MKESQWNLTIKQCMRRMYEEDTILARIAKANSQTLPTDTNGTNGVLSFVSQANCEAVETDRLGALDLDGFHSRNVDEIGDSKNSV